MQKMGGLSVCICACMLEVPLWGSGNSPIIMGPFLGVCACVLEVPLRQR